MSQKQSSSAAVPVTFEDLYAEHAESVLSLLWLSGVPDSDRKDVSQEVWTTVCRLHARFDPQRGTARAWITTIARNAARDWKRTRRRRPEFASPPEQEPAEMGTGETDAVAERHAVLWNYFERSIPSEEQREAFVLHEICELTIEEVADATGVRPCTVNWRIKMARQRLREEMTEEERRRLSAILPVLSVDGFIQAVRATKFPEDELADVWDRVNERIEAEGGSIRDPLSMPQIPSKPMVPKGYTFTGPGIASTLTGVFLLGALAGAAALYAWMARDTKDSWANIAAELPPVPPSTTEPRPDPTPTTSARTSASPSVASSPVAPMTAEAWLLERARKAEPAEALALADQHARSFPSSFHVAAREEIAIRALLKLGRRSEAEDRAAKLVRLAPKTRPTMETLFGRSLF